MGTARQAASRQLAFLSLASSYTHDVYGAQRGGQGNGEEQYGRGCHDDAHYGNHDKQDAVCQKYVDAEILSVETGNEFIVYEKARVQIVTARDPHS